MAQRPVPPRGMRDLLPADVELRHHLLSRILRVYRAYGFQQIETPLVEDIDRLLGSEGGENEKLVYKVLKRGIDAWPPTTEADAVDLGLRYDLTVPLARFFASHSNELAMPFKAIQTGPVFRAERPQKGRYRQFTQCDIDVLGDPSVAAEVELVCATAEALRDCEIGEFTIRTNHRGLLEGMVRAVGFSEEQMGAVLIAVDKMDKVGVAGVHAELRTIADGPASDAMATLLEGLVEARGFEPTLAALPSAVDVRAIDDVRAIVDGVAAAAPWVRVELDATLVRGMGYYTGPIFEVEHAELSSSIGGGGRYDHMIGKLSGVDVPAVGLSIGFERLCLLMEGKADVRGDERRVLLLHRADAPIGAVLAQAAELRADGAVVRREQAVKNRSAQLARAAAAGFTHWAEHSASGASQVQELEESEEGAR